MAKGPMIYEVCQITVGVTANHLNRWFYSINRQNIIYARNPLGFNHNIINKTNIENVHCDTLEFWNSTPDLNITTRALAI